MATGRRCSRRSASSRSRSSFATFPRVYGSNASGYDGTTVAADACFMAKHMTGRSRVVVTEATNPQVRQVVKTYAPGFGLEVVEVPQRAGTTDPDQIAAAAEDAACVIFQQPNFFGCLEPAPDLAAAANDAEAIEVANVD